MNRPYICIAGKNNIAVDVLKYVIESYGKDRLCVICNRSDTGENGFQRSLRKYAQLESIREYNLEEIYDFDNLVFLSLEFDQIIKPHYFKDARLYNIHFSLLPKYKGMYTSAHPILNGEKYSGVTLHYIDAGIDTGDIIDQEKFEIGDSTCRELYLKYIDYGTAVVLKNIENIIWNRTTGKKQAQIGSTYYSRESIFYGDLKIDFNQTAQGVQRQIRAFSFREFQMPKVLEREIGGSKILNSRSLGKPGTMLIYSDEYAILNTVDYNIVLYFDRFDEIMEACKSGDIETVKSICSFGRGYINEMDNNGWCPLIVATFNNQTEIVRYLISIGADINVTSRNGTNLLMYAKEAYRRNGDNTLFRLFKSLGLSANKRDYLNNSLIDYIDEEGISIEELMKFK